MRNNATSAKFIKADLSPAKSCFLNCEGTQQKVRERIHQEKRQKHQTLMEFLEGIASALDADNQRSIIIIDSISSGVPKDTEDVNWKRDGF